MNVLRRKVPEKEKFIGILNPQIEKNIQSKIIQEIREFSRHVAQLTRHNMALVIDPNTILNKYLRNTLSIYGSYKGTLSQHPINNPSRYSYKGLGQLDVQHIINARDLNADEFVSFDQYFRHLDQRSDFKDLKIIVL
jgi:hypothetical protein